MAIGIQPGQSPTPIAHFNLAERKIEPAWEPQILTWAAEEGSTLSMVVQKVRETFGVTVHKSTISRLVKQRRAERTELTQQVIRDNIGGYVLGDLEMLKNLKNDLVKVARQHLQAKETKLYLDTVDRIMKLSDMLFKLSGAHEKQVSSEQDAAKASLLEKLDGAISGEALRAREALRAKAG